MKEVVERNLKKIVTSSEEIGEGIEDDEEFATHLDESMNIEVNVNHKLAILNEFITKKNRQLSHVYLKREIVKFPKRLFNKWFTRTSFSIWSCWDTGSKFRKRGKFFYKNS